MNNKGLSANNQEETADKKSANHQSKKSQPNKLTTSLLQGLTVIATGVIAVSAFLLNAIASDEDDDAENETGCTLGDQGVGHYYEGLRIDDEE